MVREPGLEPEYLVNGYPWAELGEATVVDLGGSRGAVSCGLARKYPSLKMIVQVRGYAPRQVKGHAADEKLNITSSTDLGPRRRRHPRSRGSCSSRRHRSRAVHGSRLHENAASNCCWGR